MAQQIGQATDVVLVGMGDEAGLQAVSPIQQPGEIGQYRIDARQVVGEQWSAVKQDDSALALQRRTVAADLAEASEEREGD